MLAFLVLLKCKCKAIKSQLLVFDLLMPRIHTYIQYKHTCVLLNKLAKARNWHLDALKYKQSDRFLELEN